MAYFLLKTEPQAFSIDDLKRDKVTSWGGIRNYQARNFLRAMKKNDLCIIYHSSCAVPAAVGVGVVVREGYPDPLQFDKKSDYYDPDSPINNPRWVAVDVKFKEKFSKPLSLEVMKTMPALKQMKLLQKGSRLSVLPVTSEEFSTVRKHST